jgi:predicted esterase
VSPERVQADASAPRSEPEPNVLTDWCVDGWRGLDEATCYLLPEPPPASPPPRHLLIYLSGIVPPTARSPQKEKVLRIVASAATRAGVAVILPRGRRGIGPTDARDWWAWPTSQAHFQLYARAMVAEWKAARETLEKVVGRFERSYLAGSSSGAYFLAALALSGMALADFDGYAALSGGAAGWPARDEATVQKRPFYIGYASGDPTNGGPKALSSFLQARGWPVRVVVHSGGHGAREEYLDEAFAFWQLSERY